MKKTLAWILVLALIAAAAVIGTVAYLTDEVTADNVMTIGKVAIELLEYERIDTETKNDDAKVQEFTNNKKPLLPAVVDKEFNYSPSADTVVDWEQADKDGNIIKSDYTSPIWDPAKINNEVDKMVFLKNTGDYNAYVRLFFAFEAGKYATLDDFQKNVHLNLNDKEGWEWEWTPFLAEIDGEKYFIAKATYQTELAPAEVTDISLSQIALDSLADNEAVAAFGNDYKVLVRGQGIQSAGFTDPDTALDEGFGDKIPFDNITLATGIDLKTALHNLNGDDSDAANKITAKVANVTFGFNKDYADEVEGYEGTLTSVEQDAEVYTYYVPNETDNTKYDVYVLADDTIYTPKISKELFRDMTALTAVDTTNMDVSRTEDMTYAFRDCSKLTTIDTSKWNTERVQTFRGAFWACSSLAELDVSKWNTANVTDMYATFYLCANIGEFDVGGWNVSNVTNMAYMFNRCSSITSLDVDSWNVGSVTTMSNMFAGCTALETLGVSEWDVSKVVDFQWFIACVSPSNPMKIKSLDVSEWNTGSATNMFCMFYNCQELNSLDVSNWNVSNVTKLANMFEKCKALETLNVSNWNVSNVKDMSGLFCDCEKLTELDLNGWNTKAVTHSEQMFIGCSALRTIYVGDDWDMSQVEEVAEEKASDGTIMQKKLSSDNMFLNCTSLVGGKDTVYDATQTNNAYAIVDGGTEAPGYLTHINDKPVNP